MSDVASLGAARAAKVDDASKVSARDTLLSVIDEIDRGVISPKHLIVVSGFTDEDLETQVQLNHAGPYDRFGQMGLLSAAIAMIAEPMT